MPFPSHWAIIASLFLPIHSQCSTDRSVHNILAVFLATDFLGVSTKGCFLSSIDVRREGNWQEGHITVLLSLHPAMTHCCARLSTGKSPHFSSGAFIFPVHPEICQLKSSSFGGLDFMPHGNGEGVERASTMELFFPCTSEWN